MFARHERGRQLPGLISTSWELAYHTPIFMTECYFKPSFLLPTRAAVINLSFIVCSFECFAFAVLDSRGSWLASIRPDALTGDRNRRESSRCLAREAFGFPSGRSR
jgi:hypothetical protein